MLTDAPRFTITAFGLSPREEMLLRSCVKYLREGDSSAYWDMTHEVSANVVFVHPRAECSVRQLQDQGHFSNSLFVTTAGIAKTLNKPHLPLPAEFIVPTVQPLLESAVRKLQGVAR
jgi:hypothetical protein